MEKTYESYPYGTDCLNAHGHQWLDGALGAAGDPGSLRDLEPRLKISILLACVERMPWYRQKKLYTMGESCYQLALALYDMQLPFTDADLCALLGSSKHGCGHGGDVMPPFDLAVQHASDNGMTIELYEGIRAFAAGMRGLNSVKAN